MFEQARPVYRHIVVKRKSSALLTADPVALRRLHRQLREVGEGTREAVDSDLAHLVKRNHLRKTFKEVYKDGYSEALADQESRFQGGAIVVATLNKENIPGGTEPLPQHATFWTLRAPYDDMDPQQAFMETAQRLQGRFQEHSDAKIKLLAPEMRRGVTLVTVVYAPIAAYALDPDLHPQGFEVGMEFIQKTRFGTVDTSTFEVYSEDGTYPITAPNDAYMAFLIKPKEKIGEMPGFLTEEQRGQVERGDPVTVAPPLDPPQPYTPPPPPSKRISKLEFD